MEADSDKPPSFWLWMAEAIEIPKLLLSPWQSAVSIPCGKGQPVVVLPGYLTTDISSIRLRRSLTAAGFNAYGWGLGQNKGARSDLLERLGDRLAEICQQHGQPVVLVGWSLGGIYAREIAKLRPQLASLVITLGSPFSGSLRANNAWRVYEFLNDHSVDRPPLDIEIAEKPSVRTIAVWSPIDGIVSPRSARGLPDESDQQVELHVRHLGLARAPLGIKLVGRLLAENRDTYC